MTFDPYGYTDPAARAGNPYDVAHNYLSDTRPGMGGPQAPWTMPVTGGPLGQLPDQIDSALTGAGYYDRRHMSTAEAMAAGAVAGVVAQQTWKGMKRRRQVKGEYTTPVVRAMLLLAMPTVLGFALGMVCPISMADALILPTFIVGPVLFVSYLVYRICGGGRFNTNRKGSPWRSDHQRGGHRGR